MTAVSSLPLQLSASQLRELQSARAAYKHVRRAIILATIDGWTVAAFAIANGLCSLLDPWGLPISLALGALAYSELRGASQLRRLDEFAPRRLGINQILLGTLLAVYAIWRIYQEFHGPSPYAAVTAADPRIGRRIEDMARSLTVAIYGCLILFALLAQGSAAIFYFTRAKHLREYRQRTPAWILQMQQTGVMV